MVIIGLWVRLRLVESSTFVRAEQEGALRRFPIVGFKHCVAVAKLSMGWSFFGNPLTFEEEEWIRQTRHFLGGMNS